MIRASHRRRNEYEQPVGPSVSKRMARYIPVSPLHGTHCHILTMDPDEHGPALYEQLACAPDDRDWTYMADGPFADYPSYRAFLERMVTASHQQYFTILEANSGVPVGSAALMRQDVDNGVIEIGNIMYSRRLQRTVAGTEAIFLLMWRVFHVMNYRRLEWKCDALNDASRRAAKRYGFQFEGLFRQAVMYKGRNRDTAWYSIIDSEWPAIHYGFRKWLSAGNFDAEGKQRAKLGIWIKEGHKRQEAGELTAP